jgi:RimJ/RimL family protein N-acetyltransferase
MAPDDLVSLRYFNRADFAQLLEWSGDAEFLLQWAGPQFRHPLSPAQLDRYLASANDLNVSERLIYTVVHGRTSRAVGHLSITHIDRVNRSCRFSGALLGDPAMRGRGIGTRMLMKALGICFGPLGMHKASLRVLEFNAVAIRSSIKAGFRIDGVLRDAHRCGDRYWSLLEMSILEREWSPLERHVG